MCSNKTYSKESERERFRKAKKEVELAKTSSSHSEYDKATRDDRESYSEEEGYYLHKKSILEKGLKTLRSLKTHNSKALGYRTYSLAKRTHGRRESIDQKIDRYSKRLEVQLKMNDFNGKDPISIFSFLLDFQAA